MPSCYRCGKKISPKQELTSLKLLPNPPFFKRTEFGELYRLGGADRFTLLCLRCQSKAEDLLILDGRVMRCSKCKKYRTVMGNLSYRLCEDCLKARLSL